MNDKLAQGQYFFVDIVRDGIALYELEGHRFVDPKPLDAKEAYEMAKEYYEEWYAAGEYQLTRLFCTAFEDKRFKEAAFLLPQAVERLYGCYLLTTTLYSPSTHNLKKLRSLVEEKDDRFRDMWPDEDKFQRRSFERLKDAYVKARYSKRYVIAQDELMWLGERANLLADLIQKVCKKRLSDFKKSIN